jgi:phage N-6-adenine-methyltransferase
MFKHLASFSHVCPTPGLANFETDWEDFTTEVDDEAKNTAGNYSTTTNSELKAISLWQPWASLISLSIKRYETRSWKTNYRGKLLICSTAGNTKEHKEYLKIKDELQLPPWDTFPHGYAIAVCDLVNCIQMTQPFIQQQSRTEILSGDWQVGRYAWELSNVQPLLEPFVVKGKQGLFSVTVTNLQLLPNVDVSSTLIVSKPSKDSNSKNSNLKASDRWYTPKYIIELILKVLGVIDLDPCADEGKHMSATHHYTATDDGLSREWHGRVFMNPPYSCPGKWMKKLQAEFEAGRVTEAIALVPAATETKWLSPFLKSNYVYFWKGRIKFLDTNYQTRMSARQAHVLVYWGNNPQRFKEVFSEYAEFHQPAIVFDKDASSESALPSLEKVLEENEFFSREKVLEEKQAFSLEKIEQPSRTLETPSITEVVSSPSGSLYQYLKNIKLKSGQITSYPRTLGERDPSDLNHWYWGYNYKIKESSCWKTKSLSVPRRKVDIVRRMIESNAPSSEIRNFLKVLEDDSNFSREKVLEEKQSFSLEKNQASGSLYQYLKNKKLKSGVVASYPRVDGVRDPHQPRHWYWGYSYEVFKNSEWKGRTLSVPQHKVVAVQIMIDNHKSVSEIKAFIGGEG